MGTLDEVPAKAQSRCWEFPRLGDWGSEEGEVWLALLLSLLFLKDL
jgi:hypothetical protein